MTEIRVELGERSYPILIGAGVRTQLVRFHSRDRQAVIIADEAVARLHQPALQAALGSPALALGFQPGEAAKSLASAEQLFTELARARIERAATVIAFGGGVAGDLAGFVAGTWLRGVAFLQVPTTLLAAIDASVGGKTAVNLAAGKNLVGVFHQPRAVLIDTDFLATLPAREFVGGLAESVKHAAIRDPAFLAWHETHGAALAAGDPALRAELIARNCRIKADIVAQDEREADLRAILNFGHTIGHAFEHELDYELRHGECVALGMLVENALAVARGWLPAEEADRFRRLLARLGLPTALPRAVSPERVLAACRLDKKVRDSAIHFVILRGWGAPVRISDASDAEITAALHVVAA